MSLNNSDFQLVLRPQGKNYPLKLNQSALDILSLIFEFKLVSAKHISRFISQKDQVKYIYLKLRRMWLAGLLENFKSHSELLVGFPVYYTLSKKGLTVLAESGIYSKDQTLNYPSPKTLFSPNLFKHENQVVELASMEAQNKTQDLDIKFTGEFSSQAQGLRSDKTIEALTPDYVATYKTSQPEHKIYTEFERTAKSKFMQTKKIERYLNFLSFEEKKIVTVRLIFQTQGMEQSFWLNAITSITNLHSLKIFTTNLSLIKLANNFLEAVYATEKTVQLVRQGRLTADVSRRVRLF